MHSGARDTLCRTACSHNRKTNATFARGRQNSMLTWLSVGPRHPRLMVPWYPRWAADHHRKFSVTLLLAVRGSNAQSRCA
jgi:hypothetical protein